MANVPTPDTSRLPVVGIQSLERGFLDSLVPSNLEPEISSKEYQKTWARLIQKIYEIHRLTCPKCRDQLWIITFIEDEEVIKRS
jgi:hypothetical protein